MVIFGWRVTKTELEKHLVELVKLTAEEQLVEAQESVQVKSAEYGVLVIEWA